MGDMIRMDVRKLDDLVGDLCRLSAEIEELGAALNLTRYRICDAEQETVSEMLLHSRLRLAEISERSKAIAHRVVRSAEQFAVCEQYVKRCFEDRMCTMVRLDGMFLRDNRRKKQEFLSFTPNNMHFVRTTVSEGDKRI